MVWVGASLELCTGGGPHRYYHRPHHAGAGLGHSQQEGRLSMSRLEGMAIAAVLLGLGAGGLLVA